MRAGDDPLGVGGSDVPAEPEDAGAELGGGVNLGSGLFGIEFDGMRAFAEFRGPVVVTDEQAPVVGGSDGVEQIEMRFGISGEINLAAAIIAAGDDAGDA